MKLLFKRVKYIKILTRKTISNETSSIEVVMRYFLYVTRTMRIVILSWYREEKSWKEFIKVSNPICNLLENKLWGEFVGGSKWNFSNSLTKYRPSLYRQWCTCIARHTYICKHRNICVRQKVLPFVTNWKIPALLTSCHLIGARGYSSLVSVWCTRNLWTFRFSSLLGQ